MKPNHSGCAGKSGRFGTLPPPGLHSKPATARRASDLHLAAADVDRAGAVAGGQTQHVIDGGGGGPGVVAKVRDLPTQPAAQQGRRRRCVDDVATWHEGLKDVVILAQQPRVAGEGRLDVGALVAKDLQQAPPNAGAGVSSGGVVRVRDDVADAEGRKRRSERDLLEAQKGTDAGDARRHGLDGAGRPPPTPPTLPRQVQQQPFGDVATVVREQDGVSADLAGRGLEGGIPATAKGLLIPGARGQCERTRRQAKDVGAVDDTGHLEGRGGPQTVVDRTHERRCRATWKAGPGLEHGPGVGATGDGEDDTVGTGRGDAVKRVPEGLQGPAGGRVEGQGATKTGRPNSSSRAAIVSGAAAQYFFGSDDG